MSKEAAADDATRDEAAIAFEVIDLLNGFCQLVKRSPNLDGSLPMRAAQHCSPVMEGSSAGAQVAARHPFYIRKSKSGYHIQLTGQGGEALERCASAVELAVERGLIRRGSYWHKKLAEGAISLRGNRLSIWTGLVIQPKPDIWLLVTAAFNRRSRVEILPHVIASQGPVPLVLEADLAATRFEGNVWMQEEIGCVMPVRPKVKMRITKFEKELEIARAFIDYYDPSYQEEKRHHATARYRRMHTKSPREAAPSGDSRVTSFGPAVHKIRQFERFASDQGVTKTPVVPGDLDYADICNGPAAKFIFDGNSTEYIDTGLDKYVRPFEKFFEKHFPDRKGSLPGVDDYLASGSRGEAILGLVPWAFTATPTGWSTLVDAYNHPSLDADGMRGIIATDWFHTLGNVLQLHRPGKFTIRKGVPIMRLLPVPREMLKMSWSEKPIPAVASTGGV